MSPFGSGANHCRSPLQGVVSNVLAIESFGAAFPGVYMDANLKGWFVSTLLLSTSSSVACVRTAWCLTTLLDQLLGSDHSSMVPFVTRFDFCFIFLGKGQAWSSRL
ncbi:hypothetical protein JVT61DRAFT_3112 [Boletus reticuloceps]|uniref:Uncharacterized protein n=1 Tax=Boletus reticuloceps TaxID=495285 RepID=A0A8I2YNQ7_9AGAM|nr:hypothetical protein JVT61DRAFT_3112 [Boletus reticuloceps]